MTNNTPATQLVQKRKTYQLTILPQIHQQASDWAKAQGVSIGRIYEFGIECLQSNPEVVINLSK